MPLGTQVGLGPGTFIVLDEDRAESSPATERDTAAPTFRPMCIVSKRSPISATADLLSYKYSKYYHHILFSSFGTDSMDP